MPLFKSATTAVSRLAFHRILSRQRIANCSIYNQIRCLSGIVGNSAFSSSDKIVGSGYRSNNFSDFALQKRSFFGLFGGEEGNMLAKVHEERCVLGYSPEQVFNVVAAIDMYQDFLPWCQKSKIIGRNSDGTIDAELQIGFKFFVESFVSNVELTKPNSIKTKSSSGSNLFHHLTNVWEFNPGPVPGTCNLYFMVDFKFRSPLYAQVANSRFKEVVAQVIGSFNERCRLIYGPATPVPENTYRRTKTMKA